MRQTGGHVDRERRVGVVGGHFRLRSTDTIRTCDPIRMQVRAQGRVQHSIVCLGPPMICMVFVNVAAFLALSYHDYPHRSIRVRAARCVAYCPPQPQARGFGCYVLEAHLHSKVEVGDLR